MNSCSDDDAEDITKENDLPVSSVHISSLDTFAEALNHGLGVSEYEPSGKADGQIRATQGYQKDKGVRSLNCDCK